MRKNYQVTIDITVSKVMEVSADDADEAKAIVANWIGDDPFFYAKSADSVINNEITDVTEIVNQAVSWMMIGDTGIPYRSVHVHNVQQEVYVTTEDVYTRYINEGDAIDSKFYCYVPTEIFMNYDEKELEDYVNSNY